MDSHHYNEPVADPALIACPHCDLLQRLPDLAPGASARCPRCDKELWRRREDSLNRTLALTLGGRDTLRDRQLGSDARPDRRRAPGLHHRDRRRRCTSGRTDQQIVAVLVLFTAVIAPALQIGFMLAIVLGALRERPPRWVGTLLRHHPTTRTWSMIEVMMLGVLVALIKIADYATVIPGVALFVLWALVFLLAGIQSSFDPREVWERIEWADGERARCAAGGRVAGSDVVSRSRSDRDAAGPAELRSLRPALASRARRGGRALPALRRGAGLPQARQHPAHLGLPDRARRSATSRPTCCRC